RFVAVSHATQHELEDLGISSDTITVNHNGVELHGFAPGEHSPDPTLLYLGRLKKYKRLELLLDVVEAIPEVTLDVAGDGDVREAEVAAEPKRPPLRELITGFARSDTGRAAGLAAAVMVANVIALAFTIVFARVLHSDGYGSLAALVSTFLILSVVGTALQV